MADELTPISRAAARMLAYKDKSPTSRLTADWRAEVMACIYYGPAYQALMAYLESLAELAEERGEERAASGNLLEELVRRHGVQGAHLAKEK